VGQRALMCHDGDQRDAIGRLKEWSDDSPHVKDLERSGKNCQRFRMLGLRRARLDEPPAQAPARAFIR